MGCTGLFVVYYILSALHMIKANVFTMQSVHLSSIGLVCDFRGMLYGQQGKNDMEDSGTREISPAPVKVYILATSVSIHADVSP